MKQRRETQRRGPPRDEAFKAFVRTLRCIHPEPTDPCDGLPIQASHTGEDKGGSMKASDFSCLPQCPRHHTDWDQRRGVFTGWSREQRQAWAARESLWVVARWELAIKRSVAISMIVPP